MSDVPGKDALGKDARLALDLVLTIRHDGHGGVADDLADPAGLTAWARAHPDTAAPGYVAGDAELAAVRELRAAVRALFAHAVRPGEPSPADAARLMPVPAAVERLNSAAARTPTVPVLRWAEDAEPVVEHRPPHAEEDLTAVLARAAIAFLAGPDRHRLRACHAPRCVRYFIKEHPRQEWCKPSCGNRARVARHHERHKKPADSLGQ
ncbi:CGNR zinc finger domain-containing protein [Streptomyces sp. NPDC046909]|uniref:CGNR zinc finger domain-containing protein n=1 Tax=Streptomyces sp. NPDC046909 TaxID=3155617 RepID=UPI0034095BBD